MYNLMLGEDEDLERRAVQRLVEQHLPCMPLATTLNLLLSHYPQLKVIIMADFDEERLMESCLRFGAFAYLTRPASPVRIQQTLAMAAHVLDTLA